MLIQDTLGGPIMLTPKGTDKEKELLFVQALVKVVRDGGDLFAVPAGGGNSNSAHVSYPVTGEPEPPEDPAPDLEKAAVRLRALGCTTDEIDEIQKACWYLTQLSAESVPQAMHRFADKAAAGMKEEALTLARELNNNAKL